MADERLQDAFRRALMQAPQGEPELVGQQMDIEDEERYLMAMQAGMNQPAQLGGPSLEEQEAAYVDERTSSLAQAYDPQVQEQRYREALQNQMTQQVVDVYGKAPMVEGSTMTMPDGNVINLDDPNQVLEFVDSLEQFRQADEEYQRMMQPGPQQMPAQVPATPVPQPMRQAGPETPPVPAGAAVARR